jgi:hypothetical protein
MYPSLSLLSQYYCYLLLPRLNVFLKSFSTITLNIRSSLRVRDRRVNEHTGKELKKATACSLASKSKSQTKSLVRGALVSFLSDASEDI